MGLEPTTFCMASRAYGPQVSALYPAISQFCSSRRTSTVMGNLRSFRFRLGRRIASSAHSATQTRDVGCAPRLIARCFPQRSGPTARPYGATADGGRRRTMTRARVRRPRWRCGEGWARIDADVAPFIDPRRPHHLRAHRGREYIGLPRYDAVGGPPSAPTPARRSVDRPVVACALAGHAWAASQRGSEMP